MLHKILRWVGIVFGVILGSTIILLIYSYFSVEAERNKTYQVDVEPVIIPDSFLEDGRGFPLMVISFCQDCHGPALSGQVMNEDALALVATPNLTTGDGGLGKIYSDVDFVRVLRYGVGQDGRSVIAMPAEVFSHLSDQDLGQVIAFVRALPPINNESPEIELRLPIQIMLTLGLFPMDFAFPARTLTTGEPRPETPPPGVTAEYGEYMAIFCVICHGEDLSGRQAENASAGLNITPGSQVGTWTEEDFITMIRTGLKPDGKELDTEMMPLVNVQKLNDDELKALWLYLQSVPPVADPTATPAP